MNFSTKNEQNKVATWLTVGNVQWCFVSTRIPRDRWLLRRSVFGKRPTNRWSCPEQWFGEIHGWRRLAAVDSTDEYSLDVRREQERVNKGTKPCMVPERPVQFGVQEAKPEFETRTGWILWKWMENLSIIRWDQSRNVIFWKILISLTLNVLL